jgi:hypothetical protein
MAGRESLLRGKRRASGPNAALVKPAPQLRSGHPKRAARQHLVEANACFRRFEDHDKAGFVVEEPRFVRRGVVVLGPVVLGRKVVASQVVVPREVTPLADEVRAAMASRKFAGRPDDPEGNRETKPTTT